MFVNADEITVDATNGQVMAQPPRSKKKLLLIVGAVMLVLVAAAIAIFAAQGSAARKEYIKTLSAAHYGMLDGGAKAESVCNATKTAWYDAIYETDEDFNIAIATVYASDETQEALSYIEANREAIDGFMAQLKSPSDEFREVYEEMNELYDVYYDLTALALNPTGSLQTYSNNFAEYDSEFSKQYDKVERLIPEN